MTRLLLINPNTSAHVTDRLLAQARVAADGVAEVIGVTATFGAAIIGSRTEDAIAAHAALEIAARHAAGVDAVVMGVSMDSGLHAVRELLDVPVVGMAEAALVTACQLGGRIGCLTLGPRLLPLYRELTVRHGFAARVAAWRALDLPAAYGPTLDARSVEAVAQGCRQLVDEDGAEVVVLCAAVLAGCAARVRDAVPVPVIDAIDAATRQALLLAALAAPAARKGSYATPCGRSLSGVAEELRERLGRSAGMS